MNTIKCSLLRTAKLLAFLPDQCKNISIDKNEKQNIQIYIPFKEINQVLKISQTRFLMSYILHLLYPLNVCI